MCSSTFSSHDALFCLIFHFILHDADNRTSSFLYNEASLPAPSNLTQDYGTDVAQSANVAVHAHGRDALEVLPLSDATSEHITTGSVMKKT